MTVVAAIPAFNEADSVGLVVEAVLRHVPRVVVVDDGSTDETAARAECSGAIVIRHTSNRGKGAAIRTAISWARRQPGLAALALIDADGQHDPEDLPRMLDGIVKHDLDIVIGSRFLGHNNAPVYRLFGLHVLSASALLGSGVGLTDSQSGYRVLSRRALAAIELRQSKFAVESEMQFEAARHGLRVGEIPIRIRYGATARRNPVVHGVSVLVATLLMTALRRPVRLPMLLATPIVALVISRSRRAARSDQAAAVHAP